MKQIAISIKGIILLIGFGALFLMIKFPLTEGRAVNLDLISIYKDPFIIYMYIASIPFFNALYQAFKISSGTEKGNLFSLDTVNAVKKIRLCAICIITFIIGAEAYLVIVERSKSDDIAGGVAMGIFIIIISILVATLTYVLERFLRVHKNIIKNKNR